MPQAPLPPHPGNLSRCAASTSVDSTAITPSAASSRRVGDKPICFPEHLPRLFRQRAQHIPHIRVPRPLPQQVIVKHERRAFIPRHREIDIVKVVIGKRPAELPGRLLNPPKIFLQIPPDRQRSGPGFSAGTIARVSGRHQFILIVKLCPGGFFPEVAFPRPVQRPVPPRQKPRHFRVPQILLPAQPPPAPPGYPPSAAPFPSLRISGGSDPQLPQQPVVFDFPGKFRLVKGFEYPRPIIRHNPCNRHPVLLLEDFGNRPAGPHPRQAPAAIFPSAIPLSSHAHPREPGSRPEFTKNRFSSFQNCANIKVTPTEEESP